MKKVFHYLSVVLIVLLGLVRAEAQTFAVSTNIQVINFSAFLTDYANPGQVMVNLLSTDERNNYPVLLKIEISGQGYFIKSKQGLAGGKYIELLKNQPVTLTGMVLMELFDWNKLDFNGISLSEFQNQGGRLPDGPITISIAVYDVLLDKAVSNVASSTGLIQTLAPPQVISPIGEQTPHNPQTVLINWQPMHMAGFVTEYEVEIYEKNMDFSYDLIINSTAPVFSLTTLQTSYQMSDLDPLLVQGQAYLIRVKARDLTGGAVFENEGWSEIEYFVYGVPGIAACYQLEASFCAAFCDYAIQTLVCENASYALNISQGNSFEDALNEIGIGDFTVFQLDSPPDQFGFCNSYLLISGEQMTDVPISLIISSSSFSDHCAGGSTVQEEDPGFYEQSGQSPGDIGSEQSFEFYVCAQDPSIVTCHPPADNSLLVIAEFPIMAELFWSDISEQHTDLFQVQYRQLGQDSWTDLEDVSADTLKAYIGDLEGGKVYEARVRSVCSETILSDWSGTIEFNTTCIIPNAVWVKTKGTHSAEIEWTGLEYATTYELRYKSIEATKWLSIGTTEPFTVLEGLEPNTSYEFKLRVLCSETWGGFTPVYRFTTDRLCEGNTISGQEVLNLTYHSALLSWQDFSEAGTDQYSIRYKPIETSVWQVAFSAQPTLNLDYLSPDTWYHFSISRFCVDIWSEWTPLGSFRTACAPGASVWADQITSHSAKLNCSEDAGIAFEFQFRVKHSQEDWITNISPASQWHLNDLMEDTEYEYRIRVKCGPESDWSVFSETSFFTTEISCDPPGNIQSLEITPFSASWSWENAERPVKWGYYYRRSDGTPMIPGQLDAGQPGKVNAAVTEDGWVYHICLEPELLIENLTPDKWYDFKVESWCEGLGWTNEAEIQQFRTKADCKVPEGIQAVFVGTDTASIEWHQQTPDKTYHIEIRLKGSSHWTQFTTKFPLYNFGNLSADQTYEYRLQCECDNYGWTDWSDVFEFRTDECLSPTEVTKEYMNSNNSLLISWQGSAGENLYRLEYRLQDSLSPVNWTVVETTDDYVPLSDLQTDKIYEYRVAESCLSAGLFYNQGIDTFMLGRPSMNNEFFECGLPVQIFDPNNFYPLDYLAVGDSVTAGDFGVLITQSNGQMGNFSGRGYIPVPYFNRARINIKFENIKINDEYRLVDGKIKITGIGLQIISEETAALLDDLITDLETIDDLLTDAEDILEVIDEILETLVPYLPPEIAEELENAQEMLSIAQTTGSSTDVTMAQMALDTANQHLQEAMEALLSRVLNIVIESLNQLNDDFSGLEDQVVSDYNIATQDLQFFENQHNGVYSAGPNDEMNEPGQMVEVDWFEEDLTAEQEALASNDESMEELITYTQAYYEKVFLYGQMKAIQELKSEVVTNADLIPLMSALMNKDINLLDFIGSEIAADKPDEEIVPEVKLRILEGIDRVLQRY